MTYLRIKIRPDGKRSQKSYKFVVSDLKTKRRGTFLKKLGYYLLGEKVQRVFGFNKTEFIKYLRRGAKLNKNVKKHFRRLGLYSLNEKEEFKIKDKFTRN